MPDSTIWILVTNDRRASICVSRQGISTTLQSLNNCSVEGSPLGRSRCGFACNLMLELCRGEIAKAYDGLIMVAEEAMMNELQSLMTNNVSRRLIAKIVTTLPDSFDDLEVSDQILATVRN